MSIAVKRKKGLARLIELASAKKWLLFASMFLAVLGALAQFTPIVAVYLLIVELAHHARDLNAIDSSYVWTLGLVSLGSVALYGVLIYTSSMLSHVAAFNILYEIRVALANKLPRLPMGFFTQKASGEIKKVLAEDVERVELFVAHHIPDLTTAFAIPLITIVFLFIMDWRLALPALVPLPIALIVQISMSWSKSGQEAMQKHHDALARANASIVEYVRGMQVIKIFNQTADAYRQLTKDVNAFRDATKEISKEWANVYPAYLVAISSSLLFIVPVAALLLARSPNYEATVSTVLLFLMLGGGMFFPLFKLMWISSLLTQISVGVSQIDAILDMPENPESPAPQLPRDASIEFRNVGFAYEKNDVLKDISFSAPQGTLTALVGPSGAGKTTIAQLIPRFWDVQTGKILLGDVDIKEIGSETLMEQVAFVFQDGMLFFDTIEENIRMGNKQATQEKVIRAARAAQCHEFIERLPQGYATLVGEGGTYLSGGEAQRVALARAILKDAPVVVLDEATAYADPENEGKILAAFAELIRNKTTLVIAHRLSTIVDADQILVVDQGVITERGTHSELLAQGGSYARMWDIYTQSRDWALSVKEVA